MKMLFAQDISHKDAEAREENRKVRHYLAYLQPGSSLRFETQSATLLLSRDRLV
jgi:hypothetical protein